LLSDLDLEEAESDLAALDALAFALTTLGCASDDSDEGELSRATGSDLAALDALAFALATLGCAGDDSDEGELSRATGSKVSY